MQFENAKYRVIHKRKNITVTFAEHPEFSKINKFYTYTLGKYWQIKIKQFESGHVYILKMLCTVCSTKEARSLLLSRST